MTVVFTLFSLMVVRGSAWAMAVGGWVANCGVLLLALPVAADEPLLAGPQRPLYCTVRPQSAVHARNSLCAPEAVHSAAVHSFWLLCYATPPSAAPSGPPPGTAWRHLQSGCCCTIHIIPGRSRPRTRRPTRGLLAVHSSTAMPPGGPKAATAAALHASR